MLFSPKNHPRPSHQGWLTGDRIAEIKNSNVRKPSEREIASSTSELRCALEKLASTRVKVPPVELDGSRPKAMSGMKPRGRSRKRDID
jgi:hypothetical protein